jgi:hypothetical protein
LRAHAAPLLYEYAYSSVSRFAEAPPRARSRSSHPDPDAPPKSRAFVNSKSLPLPCGFCSGKSFSKPGSAHRSQCGAGVVVFRIASNALSATRCTSRVPSALGGSGAKTTCAACQNASSNTRAGHVDPVFSCNPRRCWLYQVTSASMSREAPAGARAASAGSRSFNERNATEGSLAGSVGPCEVEGGVSVSGDAVRFLCMARPGRVVRVFCVFAAPPSSANHGSSVLIAAEIRHSVVEELSRRRNKSRASSPRGTSHSNHAPR